ncbi:BtpA/SgcQ family protein [Halomicrococcus gelatinilyticus]|uniref:BtpA/SgcQ family protein n=1 Tax=Halomicrococcus gelatinilyticus TaxID=1702103 RepID=UPI002E119AA9
MNRIDVLDVLDADAPVVGMVHLPALPGAPDSDGDLEAVVERALADARALEAGGVDSVLVENFGDAPFYPDAVPNHVVASMTRVATAVRDAVDVPLGVNVLRNDADAALAVAAAVDAAFVRVNVHTGARVTDQGVVEGRAHETLRRRAELDADVAILADVTVKHSAPLADRPLDEVVAETLDRGRADGLVISGPGTGRAVDADRLAAVVDRRDDLGADAPVFVGSGTTPENAADLLAVADGAIVGSAFEEGGEAGNPVDRERVAALVDAV